MTLIDNQVHPKAIKIEGEVFVGFQRETFHYDILVRVMNAKGYDEDTINIMFAKDLIVFGHCAYDNTISGYVFKAPSDNSYLREYHSVREVHKSAYGMG